MTPINRDTVKQLRARNLTLKLLSLALALCIWSISAVSRKTEAILTIPVKLGAIPNGYVVEGPVPASINVTLSGPLYLITTAKRSSEALTLDLAKAVKPGTTTFKNLDSYLKLAQEIAVIRISPASLEIRLKTEHLP